MYRATKNDYANGAVGREERCNSRFVACRGNEKSHSRNQRLVKRRVFFFAVGQKWYGVGIELHELRSMSASLRVGHSVQVLLPVEGFSGRRKQIWKIEI